MTTSEATISHCGKDLRYRQALAESRYRWGRGGRESFRHRDDEVAARANKLCANISKSLSIQHVFKHVAAQNATRRECKQMRLELRLVCISRQIDSGSLLYICVNKSHSSLRQAQGCIAVSTADLSFGNFPYSIQDLRHGDANPLATPREPSRSPYRLIHEHKRNPSKPTVSGRLSWWHDLERRR